MPTEKTIAMAEELLPHLVNLAQRGDTATYGEAAEWIGRHPFNLHYPLAYIRDEITEPRDLPMITSLLVLTSTGRPGDSLLPDGREHLSDEEYVARCDELQQDVYRFRGWDGVLSTLGLSPIESSTEELDVMGTRYRNNDTNFEPTERQETDQEYLQRFLVENPEAIYLWKDDEPETNVTLPNGDTCDIVFNRGPMGYMLVAVRQGRRAELAAAIQKLARLRDEFCEVRDLEENTRVQARIVAYRIPRDLRDYARSYDVKYSMIRPDRVEESVSLEA